MTSQTLEKLPTNVRNELEMLRKNYKNSALDPEKVRSRIGGYLLGLRDAGMITERERQILLIYGLT